MALRIPLKFLLTCALISVATGCGGGGSDGPAVYPVKGKLTKGGQPLAGITVTFSNTEKKAIATGMTTEGGDFILISDSGKPGMVPGKAKVVLKKAPPAAAAASPGSDPGAFYEQVGKQREGGQRGAPPKAEVEQPFPEEYTDPNKTPLSFEIKTSSNEFEIPLP